MSIFSFFSKNKKSDQANIGQLADVIAQLKMESTSHKERADRYWKQLEELKKKIAENEGFTIEDLSWKPLTERTIEYKIEHDEEYYTILANHGNNLTVCFTREFDTTKGNYNWVDEGKALITLRYENVSRLYGCPTIIKSPTSGIFEIVRNKLVSSGEELCRIRIIPIEEKAATIERLERESIKLDVLKRERKKMIERETLDELIAEGKVFNIIKTKDGNRMAIPRDVANAVWNRDGGKCCHCGSKSELEFDHIIPISKGGATTFRNLQLLCKKCNLRKSDNI